MSAMRAAPFTLVFLVPLLVAVGFILGGWWNFITPLFVFVAIPVLDILIGISADNPTPEEEEELREKKAFRVITWLCVPTVLVIVFWGAYMVSITPLSLPAFIGFSISVGINSGVVGINVGHELTHRVNNKKEMLLSRIILWPTGYLHWGIEHVVGHHRHVATPRDPATARRGQSFYRFWFQTVAGTLRSVWDFEKKRLERIGTRPLGPHNRVLRHLVYDIITIIFMFVVFGLDAGVYFLIQMFVAVTLLEVINYIEHYGLERGMVDGKYERVRPIHSWNSSNRLTNWFLFNLQRHSDHHYKANRRYQLLRHYDESPQLPTGYAGMIWLAMIPPLWRRVVDPLIPRRESEKTTVSEPSV